MNKYKLEKVVGRGGFGRVWKAQEKSTNEIVAIKIMSKAKIFDRNSIQSVLNELDLLKRLNHPFIIKSKGAFQDRENLYLVLEYISGGDLRYHMLNNVNFSETQTSMDYLHSNKIIHRDLKPENIILDNNGYAYLADLGIAKRLDDGSLCLDTSGTPGYMAPEVVNKMCHSFPSDFFSLGIILFELMMKKRPYKSNSRIELKTEIITNQVFISSENIPLGWSKESADFINKLLVRKVTERLGYKGIKDLKMHPWLKDVDWNILYEKGVEAHFIPRSDDNYNLKSVSKKEPPIEDAELMISLVNKKREFDMYFYDPKEKSTEIPIFRRNCFVPINPADTKDQITCTDYETSQKKLTLKDNFNIDIISKSKRKYTSIKGSGYSSPNIATKSHKRFRSRMKNN